MRFSWTTGHGQMTIATTPNSLMKTTNIAIPVITHWKRLGCTSIRSSSMFSTSEMTGYFAVACLESRSSRQKSRRLFAQRQAAQAICSMGLGWRLTVIVKCFVQYAAKKSEPDLICNSDLFEFSVTATDVIKNNAMGKSDRTNGFSFYQLNWGLDGYDKVLLAVFNGQYVIYGQLSNVSNIAVYGSKVRLGILELLHVIKTYYTYIFAGREIKLAQGLYCAKSHNIVKTEYGSRFDRLIK